MRTTLWNLGFTELLLVAMVAAIQLTLQIWAIVDLVRRKRTRGPKWIWALIIVLGNLLGALIYLAMGRLPDAARDTTVNASAADRTQAAADVLYGRDDT